MRMGINGGGIADREIAPQKPHALLSGSAIMPFAAASPGDDVRMKAGLAELERHLGFRAVKTPLLTPAGYFAGSANERRDEFLRGIACEDINALFAIRGGYGSNYVLENLQIPDPALPKVILGFSDLTSLQIYLWQRWGWVTFYGPMIAAGLDGGAGAGRGYDRESLVASVQNTDGGTEIGLQGAVMVAGEVQGRILGGCMTLVETTIGTPWELDTSDAILLLEDRGMKPWQVDRALMHLKQAGKFEGVRAIVLGDFPDCEAPVAGSPTVQEVCSRILGPLGVPIVFGAPLGHTMRPMLTVPLGVMGRLAALGEGVLETLEPAVIR